MKTTQLIDLFQRARSDTGFAVIEGFQALKHAARFKAEINNIVTYDISLLENMLDELAYDVKDIILPEVNVVDELTFLKLSPQPPRTKVIALARRRAYEPDDIDPKKPVVFLEDPRDLENIGAVIRVAAAADAAAVVISGSVDIWHPAVIRGAAGLHYALPIFNCSLESIPGGRLMVSLDPTGAVMRQEKISRNSIFIFGTERHGISQSTLESSDQIISLPMKKGVSSLNLATSVAATLYQL